jgi:hypothetical protein
MLNWTELSPQPDRARFEALSQVLTAAGLPNHFEPITCDLAAFPAALADAQKKFAQLRIGGALCELAPSLLDHMPSTMLTLKVADSFVRAPGGSAPGVGVTDNTWWPRSYLAQGFGRALVSDIKNIDLSGAAFLLGATPETRAAVASLTKVGFRRFSIADPNNERGRSLIEDLRASHFGVQCQFIPRETITQLPSVHSIGVNTLAFGEDDGTLAELFYFNFLKPGGIWVDLALRPLNLDLEAEAKAVGAVIEPGHRIAVWTDIEWAGEALGLKLDPEKLGAAYMAAFGIDAAKS